jgi:hypothetical protein
MQYMLLFHQPATELERTQDDPASADYWESWYAYMGALYSAGIVTSGEGLEPPSTATTVRVRDGQREVLDGSSAQTKDLLGGYVIIDVPSLDEAVTWAARSPSSSTGSTEVRPVALLKSA